MSIVILPAALYLGLHLLGWYYPALLWGVDQLHYYSPAVLVVFTAVTLGCLVVGLIPPWRAAADQVVKRLLALWARQGPLNAPWFKGVLLLLFLAFAYTFRVREHLLGDSSMWFSRLELSLTGAQRETVSWNGVGIPGLAYIPSAEALDFLFHLEAFRLGRVLFSWTAQDTYEWLSCLAGLLYVSALWKITAHLGEELLERLTFFALLLCLGTLQLFFGYAESYTLLTLASALYLLSALRCLQGGSMAYPTLWLVLTGSLHLMGLSLVPSWLFLLWHRCGRPWSAALQQGRIYLPLLVAGGGIALLLYAQFYPYGLPLWTPGENGKYTLLSLPHLMLLLNALLLVSPFGLVWGVAFVFTRGPSTPAFRFLGWAFLGTGALVSLHDAYLGGRDWDLLSFAGLPGALWGCLGLGLLSSRAQNIRQVRLVVLPMLALHTALWLGINISHERAVDRLGNLLLYTNQADHYRAFARGHYYLSISQGDYVQAVRSFEEAIALAPPSEPEVVERYYKYLGKALVLGNKYGAAVDAFTRAYGRQQHPLVYTSDKEFFRNWIWASVKYSEELGRRGEPGQAGTLLADAAKRCKQLLAVEPQADLWHLLGEIYIALNQPDQAADAFQQSLKIERDPAKRSVINNSLSGVLQALGKQEGAAVAPSSTSGAPAAK